MPIFFFSVFCIFRSTSCKPDYQRFPFDFYHFSRGILITFLQVSASLSKIRQPTIFSPFLCIYHGDSSQKNYLIGTILGAHLSHQQHLPAKYLKRILKSNLPATNVAKLIMLLFADRNCDSNIELTAIQMGLEIDEKCK